MISEFHSWRRLIIAKRFEGSERKGLGEVPEFYESETWTFV